MFKALELLVNVEQAQANRSVTPLIIYSNSHAAFWWLLYISKYQLEG